MTQTTVDVSRLKDFDAKSAIDSLAHTVEAIAGQPTSIELAGATSGVLTLTVPAIVGTRTLTFPAGTTDFSSTGGTSQVLRQSTAGAAITVATLAFSELSDAATPALGAATGTSVTVTGNLVTSAGFLQGSAATTLTAVGNNRGTALALTKQFNNVTTAAASTGVVLPASATVGVGGRVIVYNNGANLIQVYAAGSDTIDGTAGSTGVALTNALRCEYLVIASGAFLSAKLGATST